MAGEVMTITMKSISRITKQLENSAEKPIFSNLENS